MKSWRFFVTAVVFVFTATGCTRSKAVSANDETLKEGNAKLEQAASLEKDLKKHQIDLLDAKDVNWRALGKADRASLKQVLLHYVALANETLAVDARRGFYVTNRDQVIRKRDGAVAKEKALESFEQKFGENFDPKGEGNPVPQASLAD